MTWEKGRPGGKKRVSTYSEVLATGNLFWTRAENKNLFWETSCDWQPALFDFCRPLSPAEWKASVFAHYLNRQYSLSLSLLCKIWDLNFCQNPLSNETRQICELQQLCPPVLLLLCLWDSCLYLLSSLLPSPSKLLSWERHCGRIQRTLKHVWNMNPVVWNLGSACA